MPVKSKLEIRRTSVNKAMPALAQKLQKFKDISVKLALSERFQEALKMCDAGIEMLEASAEKETETGIKWLAALHSAKGSTYMAQKNFEGAKGAYEKALELHAMLPRGMEFSYALDNLAKAYQAVGDIQNSIACKTASLENLEEFAPNSKDLIASKYRILARELDNSGRSAEAIEMRRKAQKLEG